MGPQKNEKHLSIQEMVLDVAALGSLEPRLQCLLELSTGDGRERSPQELGRQPEASISLGLRDTGRRWSPDRGWGPHHCWSHMPMLGGGGGGLPCFSLLTLSNLPPVSFMH